MRRRRPLASRPLHVAIAGAGPAGALLGFLLARGGVRVTLIERHDDFSREFRGEGMSPSGMAAIRAAGLWDAFDDLPATRPTSVQFYADGKSLIALDLDRILPEGMEFIRVMAQTRLLEMLVGKASAYPGFELMRGTIVRDLCLTGERVSGLIIGKAGHPDQRLDADYVIAADGRFSTLREKANLDLIGVPQTFDVIWTKVDRPSGVPKGRVYSLILKEFFGLIFPTENDQLQIGRIIAKGTYRQFRGSEVGEWYDKIVAVMPQAMQSGFTSVRASAAGPVLLNVISGALAHWSKPGICFIGDAAHPMSPIGAQGINIALRDAVIAANHFGPLLSEGAQGGALDAAAAAFETERRGEVDNVQKMQNSASRRLGVARRIAPVLRLVPDSWIGALARSLLSRPQLRSFIEGTAEMRLTFRGPDE